MNTKQSTQATASKMDHEILASANENNTEPTTQEEMEKRKKSKKKNFQKNKNTNLEYQSNLSISNTRGSIDDRLSFNQTYKKKLNDQQHRSKASEFGIKGHQLKKDSVSKKIKLGHPIQKRTQEVRQADEKASYLSYLHHQNATQRYESRKNEKATCEDQINLGLKSLEEKSESFVAANKSFSKKIGFGEKIKTILNSGLSIMGFGGKTAQKPARAKVSEDSHVSNNCLLGDLLPNEQSDSLEMKLLSMSDEPTRKSISQSYRTRTNIQLLRQLRETQSSIGFWDFDQEIISFLDPQDILVNHLSKYRNKKLVMTLIVVSWLIQIMKLKPSDETLVLAYKWLNSFLKSSAFVQSEIYNCKNMLLPTKIS